MDKEKVVMTTITIRISQEEKQKLQALAENMDMSLSQLFRRAVRELWLNN